MTAEKQDNREAMQRHDREIREHERVMTWIGASVMIFGCVLLGVATALPPPGVVDNSILFAFGEISTFSATVMGVAGKRKNNLKNAN